MTAEVRPLARVASGLLKCEDVPMHVELRHAGRRLELPFRYSSDEHAHVVDLPDGAGQMWFAAELTTELAR